MSSKIGKYFDEFSKIAELINKISISLQNFTAARTFIRDYVMTADEKHYTDVEERLDLTLETLEEAEAMAEEGQTIDVVCYFIDSVKEWSEIAQQVHDGFAEYRETVQSKVLTNFAAVTQAGYAVLQSGVTAAMDVMLDIQKANVVVFGYLLNGEERCVEDAERAIASAKAKVNQLKQESDPSDPALQTIVEGLDKCAAGFREAVATRKSAHKIFAEKLAPLGTEIQEDIEKTHLELIEIQQGIRDLRILTQHRKKQIPPIH